MPNCGGAVGGIWNTPPRSLSECRALQAEAGGDPSFNCPETPFEFVSPATAEDGTPLRIFVTTNEPKYIQTRLSKVQCNNETGWDAMGDDELVVAFGNVSSEDLAIGDIQPSADTYRVSINSGNNIFPERIFPNVRSDLTDSSPAGFMVQVGEDDDWGVMMVGGVLATVYLAILVTVASGGTAAPAIVGAIATGGLGGFLGAIGAAG